MSKDRLQQILYDTIIVNKIRINTQKYFSNYMNREENGHQFAHLIVLRERRVDVGAPNPIYMNREKNE